MIDHNDMLTHDDLQNMLDETLEEARALIDPHCEDAADVASNLDELVSWYENDLDEQTDIPGLDEVIEQGHELQGFIDDLPKGETAINEDFFEEYTKTLIEDIRGVDMNEWPFYLIDMEQAAGDLQQDFCEIVLDGVTYWFRG